MAPLTLHLQVLHFQFFSGKVIICEMGVRSGDQMAKNVTFLECIFHQKIEKWQLSSFEHKASSQMKGHLGLHTYLLGRSK